MKRSDGITIISIYFLITGFVEIAIACALTVPIVALPISTGDDPGMAIAAAAAITGLCVAGLGGILSLATGWGLWGLNSWARWLAIILAVLSLFAFPVGTVIGALIIWYLLKDEVKAVFEDQEPALVEAEVEDAPAESTEPEDTEVAAGPAEETPSDPSGPVLPDEEGSAAGEGESEET